MSSGEIDRVLQRLDNLAAIIGEMRGEIGEVRGELSARAVPPCQQHDDRLRTLEQARASNRAVVAAISSVATAGGGALAMLLSKLMGP